MDGPKKLRARRVSAKAKKSTLTAFAPPRRQRRPHVVETYSKLYYTDVIKPAVEKELGPKLDGESARKYDSRRLTVMRAVRKRLWEAETDEVKERVHRVRDCDHPKGGKNVEETEDSENGEPGSEGHADELSPAEAQKCVLILLDHVKL